MNCTFFDIPQATKLENIKFTSKNHKVLNFHIKRDDLIDKEISGNKWRKLKFNIQHAKHHQFSGIASFGGAFSNHIAALAAAGARHGISTLGFIRTHQIDLTNPTLTRAKEQGMTLVALDRQTYRKRHELEFIEQLQQQYPTYFFVPEGGSNDLAAPGMMELADELKRQQQADYIACAIGSGGTISGLLDAMPKQKFLGVPVVKDSTLLHRLSNKYGSRLKLLDVDEFGGYGKFNQTLEEFCMSFFQQTLVPIEPIYTGKMLYALCHFLEQFPVNNYPTVTAIHTGGLQGIRGLIYRHQIQPEHWLPLLAPKVV